MHRGSDPEAGVGLVELLIAIVLLGVGAVAILASFATVIRLSKLHNDQTSTTNALTIAAEAVASPVVAYQPCAGVDPDTGAYRSAINQALTSALNSTAVTFSVTYWNGTSFDSTCRDTDGQIPTMERMQRVELSAVVPDQSNPWTLTIVKRAA